MGAVAVFVGMTAFLGAVLLVRALRDLLLSRSHYRWVRQVRKWLLLRQYLGKDASAEAVIATYLPSRRAARQRAARRRAGWQRDLRAIGRTSRLALVAMLSLGFFLGFGTLVLAAERDAQARIAGQTYKTNFIYEILTPGAVTRPVEVIAQDPRLRSLETTQVLYLGSHDGMQVLYDRTKKRALLVPAGSVTLILPPR
jgi:hypothetical protein